MIGIAGMAIAYVLSQFFRSFMAVLTPQLTAEIGATTGQLSLASGLWFVAFALSQFAIGPWLDRYGPRRTLAAIFGLCGGGGAFLFAAATRPWMLLAGMTLIGIGCAPVLMAAMFVFARNYPARRLAVLTSTFIAVGSAGNVAGTAPLAAAAETFGWRPVMAAIGVLVLLTAGVVLKLVRDPARLEGGAGGRTGALGGYRELLRIGRLWPIIPLIGMNYAPLIGIMGLWAGPFLAEVHGAGSLTIGNVTFFMALAAIAGSFLYGPLDTLFGTRKWVAVAGNALSIAVLAWLALNPGSGVGQITLAFALVAVCGSSFGLLMAHARAFVPVHLTGRGITLLNFFSIGTVGAMQFLTGWVVTAAANPADPATTYAALFGFYAATLAAALAVYLLSHDARPEKTAEAESPARPQQPVPRK